MEISLTRFQRHQTVVVDHGKNASDRTFLNNKGHATVGCCLSRYKGFESLQRVSTKKIDDYR
jgi:hypothetical protein